ncbi:5-oxoprolinase subunit PxpB [Algibacter pacificus]|uniref:5-oxoprolinase subunit PxpB n=1 Tax=Algibacter pacificus TaxID=2599389 RepID=UPI0011C8C091|nr:5-oxoprolinase subunit PxpB [Algibacter pacificus]
MGFKLRYKSMGLHAVLVEWPAKISQDILKDVLLLKEKLENFYTKELVYVSSSYNSLLVNYGFLEINFIDEIAVIDKIYVSQKTTIPRKGRIWKIPVCYDDCFALDLDAISSEKNMTKKEIISRHSQQIYTVYFIGFLPGFLYLGGMDKLLITPRKQTPRLEVEKGAVAIGGHQTGVYPNASPGGWNIIGNSPINFFDVSKEMPCFAKAGDQIQFYPISLKAHGDIKILADAGVYHIKNEAIDD